MTFEELNTELQKLVGERVSFVRIVCNSIILYFRGEPGDDSVVTIWMDPSWRFQRHGKIMVGSYDLQVEEADFASKEEYQQEYERIGALTDGLEGATLESVHIDSDSSDIFMTFSDHQVVSNFDNSAFDEEAWRYRDRARGITVAVSSCGIKQRIEKR